MARSVTPVARSLRLPSENLARPICLTLPLPKITADGHSAQLCVLLNQGDGQFVPGPTFSIDPNPDAIQTINFGDGLTDLAVADIGTGNSQFLWETVREDRVRDQSCRVGTHRPAWLRVRSVMDTSI